MTDMQSVRPIWHEELLAGTALFCCLYYVVSMNSKILGEMHIPPSSAIAATFLSLIFCNLSGAIWTRTGLMIAPAIGISTFVSTFVQTFSTKSATIFGVGDAMLGCAFAGVVLVVTSWKTDLRSRVIEEMPDAVRRGVIAAIGALLVYEALKQYLEITGPQGYVDRLLGTLVIAIGLAILIGFYLIRRVFSSAGVGVWTNIVRFSLRIEFVLVIALSSVVLHLFEPPYKLSPLNNGTLVDLARARSVVQFPFPCRDRRWMDCCRGGRLVYRVNGYPRYAKRSASADGSDR